MDKLRLPPSSSFLQIIWGVSGFSYRKFFIFQRSQLSEFSTDLQEFSLKIVFIISGKGLSSHEPVQVIVGFQYLIKRRNNFFETPSS